MGKGKGSHHVWISLIRKGQIICEVSGISTEILSRCMKALKAASSKLSIQTVIIYNYY